MQFAWLAVARPGTTAIAAARKQNMLLETIFEAVMDISRISMMIEMVVTLIGIGMVVMLVLMVSCYDVVKEGRRTLH